MVEEILSGEMKEILNPMEREINLIIIFQILKIFKENKLYVSFLLK